MLGVLVGCRGAPASGGDVIVASAPPPSPSAASSTQEEPSFEFWPLRSPEHWTRVDKPDPSLTGKTRPCKATPNWSSLDPPNWLQRNLKPQVYMCKYVKPVMFPICTEDQMSRAVRLDAIMKGKSGIYPPEFDENEHPLHWSFRGYIMRDYAYEKSILGAVGWRLELRSFDDGTGCSSISIKTKEDLCEGTKLVSCCRNGLIDSNVEVLFEVGFYTGMQLCIIPGQNISDVARVQTFFRSSEDTLPQK